MYEARNGVRDLVYAKITICFTNFSSDRRHGAVVENWSRLSSMEEDGGAEG